MPNKRSHHRKRFGQVFLRDPLVVEKIVQCARLAPSETVLEIGPGRGALTVALAQRTAALYAIEIEASYVAHLRRHFAAAPHVHILHADARRYDYAQLPAPLVVVANLPYSMGMPILRHLFAFRQRLSRLIIMLQQEVAARLLAAPGTSAYGALSIFFQYHATLNHAFEVSRHAFTPIPAVDSTVITLQPYNVLPWPSVDEPFFFWLVKSAFAHRRKMLRTNLLAIPQWSLTRAELDDVFHTLGLPLQSRPQDLHVAQFVHLSRLLHPLVAGDEAPRRGELEELA
jgi:16S rRNA (adenine1518-N6/adenine1519-N6)-dimethyltransferase